MFQIIKETWRQGGVRTMAYPAAPPAPLPSTYRGLPILDDSKCPAGCRSCIDACPTDAISHDAKGLALDLGRCLFCTDCTDSCPEGAITFTQDHRLAVRKRDDLIIRSNQKTYPHAEPLPAKMLRLFGRSLRFRFVSAAGDNAEESDLNVLTTIVWDISRFGMQYVASPRHADGLVIAGPVSENMRAALLNCYESVPTPKIVIAVGTNAVSGGPYRDLPNVHNGVDSLLPVDLYIPGYPPHPLTILDGFLRLVDRLGEQSERIDAVIANTSAAKPIEEPAQLMESAKSVE